VTKISGLSQKKIANQIFEITAQALSNQVVRNRIDLHKLIFWASQNNIDLNWLIWGDGHEPDRKPPPDRPMDDDERTWWRGLTDELRGECRRLKKRLEYYEDPHRKSRIRKDDDPAERDEILRKRVG